MGKNWRKRPLVFSFEPRCQGACGSSEPYVDLQAAGEFGMAGHLAATVVEPAPDPIRGHRAAQGGGQAFHLPGEAFQRRVSGAAANLAENEITGLALDHRAHRRAVERPLDQVTFPMTGHKAALDFFRAMDDPQ